MIKRITPILQHMQKKEYTSANRKLKTLMKELERYGRGNRGLQI